MVVHAEVAEGIGRLRIDRPPANALTTELLQALGASLEAVINGGARAIVLTGRPGMFSGGLDVPVLLPEPRAGIRAFWEQFFAVNRALAESPVPVIAAISGHAPAGGAILALHCDFRIAAAGRYRIGLNEVHVGLPVPPTILAVLTAVVGPRAARWLAVRGELVPVAEAAALGLVDRVVPEEELPAAATALATELAALPPVAMNTTRRNTKATLLQALAAANDVELATEWWFSAETQAGMQRLVERLRKP
jgi:enoyl-CoA hydratase/carnithine racemase